MTSQKYRHQKVQDDKYSHEDAERLHRQNKTVNEKAAAKAVQEKKPLKNN